MNARAGDVELPCCARLNAAHEDEKRLLRMELHALRAEVDRLTEAVHALTDEPSEK